jgi:hypothetical protein
MRQNESRKEGGEGKVSAEMIVASQGDDFLGDKVAFQGDNLTEFTNDGDALDMVACDAIQCNDSASAPLDMLRHLDKDTVRRKGAQTEEKISIYPMNGCSQYPKESVNLFGLW